MTVRLRYVETIGVGELVLVGVWIGRVVGVAKDDPRFGADVLTIRIPPTSERCGCTVEALPRACMPLPEKATSWGLRFIPGPWSA